MLPFLSSAFPSSLVLALGKAIAVVSRVGTVSGDAIYKKFQSYHDMLENLTR